VIGRLIYLVGPMQNKQDDHGAAQKSLGDYIGFRSRWAQMLRTWLAEFHPCGADAVGRYQLKVKMIGIITTWIEERTAMLSEQMCDRHDLLREVWGQHLLASQHSLCFWNCLFGQESVFSFLAEISQLRLREPCPALPLVN
jgi:hypothetical protein